VVGGIAALIAAVVEFSRLWHTPGFDAFRETLAGKLLLGRFFSLRNIAAYWIAIGLAMCVDAGVKRRGDSDIKKCM